MLGGGTKAAMTFVAEFKVTEQAPLPVHAPAQPPKVEGEVGVSVRMTAVPAGYVAEHVPVMIAADSEQLICWRLSVTLPVPVPVGVTVKVKLVLAGTKVADSD